MSRKRFYDEASVIKAISKKNSINVTKSGTLKVIEIVKNSTDVGCGTWGKIDYLTKVHGYVVCFVTKLVKSRISKSDNDSETKIGSNKTAKREQKLNMAKMSKDAMKKVAKRK